MMLSFGGKKKLRLKFEIGTAWLGWLVALVKNVNNKNNEAVFGILVENMEIGEIRRKTVQLAAVCVANECAFAQLIFHHVRDVFVQRMSSPARSQITRESELVHELQHRAHSSLCNHTVFFTKPTE